MCQCDPAFWPESYPRPTAEQHMEAQRLREKNRAISKRTIQMLNTSIERSKRGIK